MRRTTIAAEESVLHRLHQLADTRGISFATIVREALEEKLEREQPPLTFLDVPFEPPPGWPSAREFSENDLPTQISESGSWTARSLLPE